MYSNIAHHIALDEITVVDGRDDASINSYTTKVL